MELDTIAPETEALCPPSVSQNLWDIIPSDRRKEAVELAALNLRRGIHPDNTIEDFLLSIGVEPPAPPRKFTPKPFKTVPYRSQPENTNR